MPPCDIVALPPISSHAAFFSVDVERGGMRARHQLPSSFGKGTGVDVGVAAGEEAGLAESVAEAVGDALGEVVGEADGVALAVALGLELALAEGVGVSDAVGSTAGTTASAGFARPESRMPAPATATTEVVRAVRTERLTSHMRSIITRGTGGGSNRGNLGESVNSSKGSLLTGGMGSQHEAEGAQHGAHSGLGQGERHIRQLEQ